VLQIHKEKENTPFFERETEIVVVLLLLHLFFSLFFRRKWRHTHEMEKSDFVFDILRDYREMKPIKQVFENYKRKSEELKIDMLDLSFQQQFLERVCHHTLGRMQIIIVIIIVKTGHQGRSVSKIPTFRTVYEIVSQSVCAIVGTTSSGWTSF
jgi:hypothetical protein